MNRDLPLLWAPQMNARQAPTFLFIAGSGRSGSTLVEMALGEDPDYLPVGELMDVWLHGGMLNEFCGCGETFQTCPFWVAVGKVAFGGWDHLDVERVWQQRRRYARLATFPRLAVASLASKTGSDLIDYRRSLGKLYHAIHVVSEGKVIVDASKQAQYLIALAPALEEIEADLRVLHLVRDPRAVAYSWTTKRARPQATTDAYSEMPRYSIVRSSLNWFLQHALIEIARPGSLLRRMRYEDFTKAPREELSRVLTALNLQWAGGPTAPSGDSSGNRATTVNLSRGHGMSGNPLRHEASQRVEIRGDDRWVSNMRTPDRVLATLVTLPLLAKYRYRVVTRSPGRTINGKEHFQ